MDSVWIVYQPDWSGIALYFDELSAYKAAVKEHAEVVQVGEGDIKEQVKNPRIFPNNKTNQEQLNGNDTTPTPSRRERQRQNRQTPSINDEPVVPIQGEGFTADQLEAQRRLKADEEGGVKDIGSLVRGR